MNATNASRSAIQEICKILGTMPDTALTSAPIEKLALPEGLFDEKTPLHSGTVIDNILPIIVTKTENSHGYFIVDGCKRFLAFKKNKTKECGCVVVSKVLDSKSFGLLRIALNAGRPMHLREKLCFFKWLIENYSGELCESLLAEAGLLSFGLKPLASCAEDIVDAVAEDRINIRNAEDFSLLDKQDRKAFLEIFKDMKLSRQTQHEFLEWLPEIAFSRDVSVPDLLRSREMTGIMND